MVFYIIAATERAGNSKVGQKIQYKTEDQIKNKIKQTKSF